MQVGETGDEERGTAESGYQRGHVLWDEEGVHPRTAFVGFVAVGVEVARCEVVEGGAKSRVLVAECSV